MRTTFQLARLALLGALFFLFVPRRPDRQPARIRGNHRR
jgi:hypothetical protein